MSDFTIEFNTNLSEPNKITKSLTLVATARGVLREGTSILNPKVMIDIRGLTSTTVADILQSNYAVISAFGRSYFIKNIEFVTLNLIMVTMRVDVLSSFKNEILTNSGIIKCNEKEYNLYLNDGQFKVYQNNKKIFKTFQRGFTASNGDYILIMAGGSNSNS